jgi:nucleotide-binding universal stress UspA family protein
MSSFRQVLVPIDFSRAAASAVAFAGAVSDPAARLTLLHVHPYTPMAGGETLYPPPAVTLDPQARAALIDKLDALAGLLRPGTRTIDLLVREGYVGPEILHCAERSGADLIVMGVHARRGFDRLLAGSVGEHVAGRAACSVLGVHGPEAAGSASPPTFAHVVCAVDLTASSHETLELAAAIARRTRGARLTVLHAIELWHWDDPWPLARGDETTTRRFLWESANAALSKLVARHAFGNRDVDILITFGRPRDEIVRVARERGAGLVVVGAHSRGRFERLLFGSTAKGVLSACPCPVLIARSKGRPPDAGARDEKPETVVA